MSTESIAAGAGDDDCAVIELARADYKYLVATTDMLQESTHLPVGISPFQIGWSAVAVNLSGIAAMGARPYAFTIAMGIPVHTETALRDVDLRELAFFYGGDYELLFTVAADVFTDEFAKRQKKVGISVIGVVVPYEEVFVLITGQGKEQIKIKGYQHF